MATPVKQALTAIRGDDFGYAFRLQRDGAPIDLTGKVGVAQIRFDLEDDEVAATMTVAIEGPAGRVRLSLGHTETERLGAEDKSLVYSVRLQNADGSDRRTWLQGPFKIQTVSTR